MGSSSADFPVLLLKTQSTPTDDYATFFKTNAFTPTFHPVLAHTLKPSALAFLSETIPKLGTPDASYGGIIFTSQRAVEAVAAVTSDLQAAGNPVRLAAEFPLYVVGPATARALHALSIGGAIVGEETGNGDALASFILDDYGSRAVSGRKPLLFLVGEKRRDIIPRTLMDEALGPERRIEVVEREVYETKERESFSPEFETKLKECVDGGAKTIWVIVFSPQGCEAMLRAVKRVDPQSRSWIDGEEKSQKKHEWPRKFVRIASIGPTTKKHLMDGWCEEPDVCPDKPNATSLGEAITNFMKEHDTN
jgi:uroporphyrinogen-III synthase